VQTALQSLYVLWAYRGVRRASTNSRLQQLVSVYQKSFLTGHGSPAAGCSTLKAIERRRSQRPNNAGDLNRRS
jgi:hypothetical protein